MRISALEKTYIYVLLVILGGIVLHAPLSVALGTVFPEHTLLIKSWKEVLMLLLIPVACLIVWRRKLWSVLVNDWLFRLISLYALLHFVMAIILFKGTTPMLAGLAIDLRYLLFFGLMYVGLLLFGNYRRLFLKVGLVGAIIVVGFATLQLFLPYDILAHIGYSTSTIAPYLTVDKNFDYIRVNSTLRGPNPLGAYAVMVLTLLVAWIVKTKAWLQDKRRVGLIVLIGVLAAIALWISYSRAALVGVFMALLLVLAMTVLRRLPRSIWITGCVVLFALAGMVLANRSSSFITNILLHENPSDGSIISSNDGHYESLQVGIHRLLHQPFGGGVGSTGSASLGSDEPLIIENQYLFVAHEVGWLGLLLFVLIFFGVLNRLWEKRQDWLALGAFASGGGLALIGLLHPVWVDDTVSIIWWGLAAIALAKGKYERKASKQKTA